MLGSIKAALATAAASIKSAIPTVVAATTATVLAGGCIYYYTIKDGIYEKRADNVRYVLEKYISQITVDSITKKDGNKGYTYTEDFEKLVENIIKELDEAESNIAEYTGKNNKENIIKKFIKAEIITQYPDLRNESEIRNNSKVSENELQGGIKIIRKDSSTDTSAPSSTDITYTIGKNDQILTYIPYSEFSNKIANNDGNVKKYFSIKSSGENTTSIDIVVAGWTEEKTTVKKVEYIPKNDGTGDEKKEYEPEVETKYTFNEISINYQNTLSKYSMPAGFLWSLLVMGESTTFVEKLANLAINNTQIIIESQDNVATTVNTNEQRYTYKKDVTKTVVAEDGTKREEKVLATAQTESSITTTVETKQSNTSLNLTYAETWVATYKKDYKNTVTNEEIDEEDWLKDAEWNNTEDIDLGTDTQVSDIANEDKEYEDLKSKIIEEITEEKCKELLTSKIGTLKNTNTLYYVFNWDAENGNNIYSKSVEYMYNYIKSGFIEEFINNITIKSQMDGYITNFWNNKSKDVENIYSANKIEKSNIVDDLYKMLEELANSMITMTSAQTTVVSQKIENKTATNVQTVNTNTYTSAGTNVQERIDVDKENNFVAYFNASGRAKEYILQAPDWLYEMFESHEKTANMVDLFRYLLYEATDNDYGVTTFDFSIINASSFNSMGSGIVGGTVEEKVWFTLKSKGIPDIAIAGIMGNIYGESSFNPSAVESNGEGIGLCQWSFGRKEQLIKYAESKGTTWQDVNTQIEFLLGEINKNGGANGYARYQMGVTCYGYTYDTWYNAQDTDTATKAFMAVFERPNMKVAHTDRRCTAAENYLKEYQGKTISGGIYTQDGSNGIIGRFTSNITGRTFTVYNQNHSSIGLEGMCNRAVAASIASGYKGAKTEMEVISDVKAGGTNILSNSSSTEAFFNKYGLKVLMNEYSYSVSNMRTILTQGKYIAIWFRGAAVGKSGSTYSGGSYNIHWIGILGYRNENGTEQIFISDPGWGSSGWRDIDEFENCKSTIVHFHTIYEK